MIRKVLGLLALIAMPVTVQAERDASQTYFFGNSLVNHLSEESDFTNVPHWVNELAKAAGKEFAIDGQWGFLRNFADGLPPSANWSFPGVRGVWSPDRGPFGQAGFDAVVITPANFIQYQQPDVPFDGDNPTGESPLGAVLRLQDWLGAQGPQARVFLYEGWAAMGEITGAFPPDEAGFARYVAYNASENQRWFADLQRGLAQARPDQPVGIIPVASILAELLGTGGLLEGIEPQALFTDDAPHGTPSLYFLAAMVTYAALYDAQPPMGYQPPVSLYPAIVDNYAAISETIWNLAPDPVAPSLAQAGATAQAPTPVVDLPERQPVALPPAGLRPDGAPALGMGLNGLADWSTQHPFIDVMKTARDWVGHLPDQWGGVSSDALRAGGYLDAQGWPIGMPQEAERLESVLFTDQPRDAEHLRGDYVLLYDGEGPIRLTGRASRVRYEPGRITFRYEPGPGLVGLSLQDIPAQNPIRNIRILRQDHLPLYEAGVLFNPLWIERVQNLRVIRFMDWMMTNGSVIQTWQDRPRLEDATWTAFGVPVEVMVRLANQIGADPWFTMPHLADDDYVRRFAELVQSDLDPQLKSYVEFSNEVWNFVFPQALWAAGEAEALWGPSETGWAQIYGMRAAQIMDVWTEVFGAEAEQRLIRVVATHTGWPGIEEQILSAPLAFLQLGRMPRNSFDAYAITGYFGYEMGGPEMAQQMNTWLDAAEALAVQAGQAQGLRRVALREFVRQNRFEGAIAAVTLALEQGSLRELVTEIFPYHAGVARREGLHLVMYEGGTHATAHGAQVNDERLTAFFEMFNYTPEMAKLYEILLGGWVDAGGTVFNAFVDVAPATKWGSWGALRHLNDSNPRWDMLMAYNASAPQNWETRPPQAFADGITRIAGSGNQRLQGTSQDDILIAGSGDDTLISSGGWDHFHGGPGTDRAVLPGDRPDYEITREDGRLVAKGPRGTVRMTAIETLVFEADPTRALATSGF